MCVGGGGRGSYSMPLHQWLFLLPAQPRGAAFRDAYTENRTDAGENDSHEER